LLPSCTAFVVAVFAVEFLILPLAGRFARRKPASDENEQPGASCDENRSHAAIP